MQGQKLQVGQQCKGLLRHALKCERLQLSSRSGLRKYVGCQLLGAKGGRRRRMLGGCRLWVWLVPGRPVLQCLRAIRRLRSLRCFWKLPEMRRRQKAEGDPLRGCMRVLCGLRRLRLRDVQPLRRQPLLACQQRQVHPQAECWS